MLRVRLKWVLAAVIGMPIAITGVVASPSVAAPAPLTIALVTDETGLAGSQYVGAPAAFEARLAMQNAHGGVNGHKLVPLVIDTQTSPAQVATGVQDAISKGVIGIVSNSSLFFLAAKYAQQAGVPVTGNSSDGPEWGEQPNTNMFAADWGSVDPKYPVNTLEGQILTKLAGTSPVLATYGYSIAPYSARATIFDRALVRAFRRKGCHPGRVGPVR